MKNSIIHYFVNKFAHRKTSQNQSDQQFLIKLAFLKYKGASITPHFGINYIIIKERSEQNELSIWKPVILSRLFNLWGRFMLTREC